MKHLDAQTRAGIREGGLTVFDLETGSYNQPALIGVLMRELLARGVTKVVMSKSWLRDCAWRQYKTASYKDHSKDALVFVLSGPTAPPEDAEYEVIEDAPKQIPANAPSP